MMALPLLKSENVERKCLVERRKEPIAHSRVFFTAKCSREGGHFLFFLCCIHPFHSAINSCLWEEKGEEERIIDF
jgi:hypothetical protein